TSYSTVRSFATPGALAISTVGASTTPTTISLTWQTSNQTTGTVFYGTTMSYGGYASDPTLITTHGLTLTNLTPATTYHLYVYGTDAFGQVVASPDLAVMTPGIAPPTITSLHNGDLTGDTRPTIAGTGPVRGSVYIVVDRKLARTVPVDSAGQYVVDLLTPLSLGPHTLAVRGRATNGDISNESEPITITVVRLSVGVTVVRKIITDGATPAVTFYVVAPGRSVVTLLLDGVPYKTYDARAYAIAYGFITKVAVPLNLAAGQHRFSFVAVDRYGRPSAQTGKTTFTVGPKVPTPLVQYRQSTQYTVRGGDSLWSIALELTHDGRNWKKIQQANIAAFPSLATNPGVLRAGWILTIPAF
ncbi:MAG: LysM peptidoglycan-binding domain-containing protein, partial [Candidatus Kerfeldbacteria bacterium]|nr:LysM peptidoglycan-binding domain-containing protein [Candidatus Kerfeldbacteria bacterium]